MQFIKQINMTTSSHPNSGWHLLLNATTVWATARQKLWKRCDQTKTTK